MKGLRWLSASLLVLQQVMLIGAGLVAGMSASGDWLRGHKWNRRRSLAQSRGANPVCIREKPKEKESCHADSEQASTLQQCLSGVAWDFQLLTLRRGRWRKSS
jgi:hypothetical protein